MKLTTEWVRLIAEVVIACCAVLGFVFAVYQYRQTADVIQAAKETFTITAYPLVKFKDYQWWAPTGGPDCEHPATGINALFQNISGVPVAVEGGSIIEVFMGDKPISIGPPEVMLGYTGERILGPGEVGAKGRDTSEIPGAYVRLRGMAEPRLNFRLTVTYRSLITGKRYRYKVRVGVIADCHDPKMAGSSIGEETIAPVD